MDFGINGVTTTYVLKTFFGPVPLQKKGNFDKISQTNIKLANVQKDLIRFDLLFKESRKNIYNEYGMYGSNYNSMPSNRKNRTKHNKSLIVGYKDPATGTYNTTSHAELRDRLLKHPELYINTFYGDWSNNFNLYTTNPNPDTGPPSNFDKQVPHIMDGQ